MKIMFVLPRFPYPLDKGDKLRAYHQIRCLAANKENQIYLYCVSHSRVSTSKVEQLRRYCKGIKVVHVSRIVAAFHVLTNFLRKRSLQIGYWDSARARREFKRFEKKIEPDVLYCQMVRTMTWVAHSKTTKVLDFQDALSMNTGRRMAASYGFWRFVLHYEFKMLRNSEYKSFDIFDALTIISEADSEAIPHKYDDEIHVIPNGVNIEHFQPTEAEKQYDIVFCGNMHYEPNVSAAMYLVNEIMPLVWQRKPDAKVLIAGASPTPAVRKLAHRPNVTVSGWMPDIRNAYAQSRLFVAPMQTGSGLQNKLLEAMAMHLPCVTTSLANNSLHATAGEHVFVADKAEDLADTIIMLLGHEEMCQNLADAGLEFVRRNYSWEHHNAKLDELLHQIAIHRI
ncbi:MAG: glycosyltransferase [Bacteroidales bacterium]|nr:glycosyltransferase [Bacteroidales bacterium]